MENYIKTIANQINWKELKFAGFKFVYDNDNLSLKIFKGVKHFIIKLDEGRDLYDIRKIRLRNLDIIEDNEIKGVYCDQLCDMIEEFFKFEYINKVEFCIK